MIKDIKISNEVEIVKIPEKGLYVELNWMYGDADGCKDVEVGPFPESRKELFIEFLNTLQLMVDEYKDGKGGWDIYNHIPGVTKFFVEIDPDCPEEINISEEDEELILSLGAKIELEPCNECTQAMLLGFKPFFRDGASFNKYILQIKK